MNIRISIRRGWVAVAACAAVAAVTDVSAAPPGGGGHAVGGGGGFHGGGFRGGYGARGYYGGWRGGYYGGWRGGYYGWGGWGCCGWGWGPGWGWVGLGWYLSALPYDYQTYWYGGVPYYYANNGYYVWDGSVGQYEAVQPPSGAPSSTPPNRGTPAPASSNGAWTDLFAYPKGGQSMEQQTKDRDECRSWAISQSGFDPSRPPQDPRDAAAKREGYLRAEGACLTARNYSVK